MLTTMNGADDLARLREEFPGWRFGTVWTTVATGPDVRRAMRLLRERGLIVTVVGRGTFVSDK